MLYQGVATADVDLNDGGVWVTGEQHMRLGRLNHQIDLLDGSLASRSNNIDVRQEGHQVFLLDRGTGVAQQVDPAAMVTTTNITMPGEAAVELGGGTIALLDPGSGAMHVAPADAAAALADEEREPAASLGPGAAIAVGKDGTAYGLAPGRGTLLRIPTDFDPETDSPEESTVTEDGAELTTGEAQLTVVGEEAVGLLVAEDGGALMLRPGRAPTDLSWLTDFTGARLQAASAAGRDVLIAVRDGVVRVPLGRGKPQLDPVAVPGPPSQPVVVEGCGHIAWGPGSMTYRYDCGHGEAQDVAIPKQAEQPQLVFRVNRDVVVLNDMRAGTVWLVQEAMELVENWEDVTPPQRDTEDEEDSHDQIEEQLPLDREEENRDPVANNDEQGLRAGSTTIVEVLANDTDPDGDLLTITDVTAPPAGFGEVRAILGGRALQVDVAPGATGSFAMGYAISDGRGGTAEATARLSVVASHENRPPQQQRPISLTLTSGATATINVLDDVVDPDGDEVVVVGVAPSTDDVVRFTPDGVITFIDSGVQTGRKPVSVTVSDGRDQAEIDLDVEVRAPGSLAPVPVFDFLTAVVDQQIVVHPLANDNDPDGNELRLADVEMVADAEVVPDYDSGTFHFTATRPGTYYLSYIVVSDAGHSATGLIRIDATEPTEAPPIAVQDTALLPAGGHVLVDVLDNDHDPGGGVLAVQGVSVPPDDGLVVAILDHRILRISATTQLPAPARLRYDVSNGEASATGEVVVMPIPPDSRSQPPVAQPDVANVRAGDYVTIPVLSNDSHPGGRPFELVTDLQEEPAAGHMFTSGDTVRFRAPEQPQSVKAVYEIVDDTGQRASAQLTVHVQADDGERNSPPLPQPVEGRAFAGERVRIEIPTFGIDPDGDSVQLLGADEAPRMGRIVEVGPTYLDYEAYSRAAGTDEFTYAVRDRLGAYASASIRVGIIPPPPGNRAPQAVDDEVHIRPGRSVDVAVLANDTDPDGDPLFLADPAVDAVPDLEVTALDGNRLQVYAAHEGTYALPYHLTDARGGTDTGVLTVRVDEEAPLIAPIAVDDVVHPATLMGRERVTIPVLDNDIDPDGAAQDLTVTLVDAPENARVVGNELQVEVHPTRQVLTYGVTDIDGLTSYAFVDVPGVAESGPVLRADAEPIVVLTGETREIDLADYVVAFSGEPVRLTDADKVQATNSDGAPPVVGPTTLSFTSADGYAGPASITFEVTDGASADDPTGLTSVLTLDITVESQANQPPTFDGTEVDLVPGETPVELNLRQLADDPDPGDFNRLQFDLVNVPEGISAQLEGPTLTVSAPPDTPRGTTGQIELTVSDRKAEPVPGVIDITITASNRRLAVVNDHDLGELHQGESRNVDVLAGSFNPFPDQPLRLVDTTVETGGATAAITGFQVAVTAGNDHVGRVTIRYLAEDATRDLDRVVEGRITFSVIGVPERPSPPRVVEVGDRSVVLNWTAPGDNGAPITGYRVETEGRSQECPTTTCTITGLTNARDYVFTLTALNAVGESPTSGPSAVARPDVKPERPQAPTLSFGDGELEITWPTPVTRGSPVSSYDLQIAPSPGGAQVSVTGNSHTWRGLTNGQSYTVRVRAHNDAPEPSEWSEWSAAEVPAGVPETPAAATMERIDSPVEAQIRATWQAPAANGDPIASYELTILRDGQTFKTMTVPGGQTSLVAEAPVGSDYTVQLRATNKAGTSQPSPPSNAVRSFVKPDAITSVRAEVDGTSGTLDLSYTPPADNGEDIRYYEYRLGSGGWQRLNSNNRITGLNNGTSYTVQLRACNTYCGDASPSSNAVVPYGPLAAPTLSARTAGTDGKNARFDWRLPAGNGRDITRVEFRVNGGGWESVGIAATGSKTITGNWDTRYAGEIRVTRADGAQRSATATVRTNPQPPPPTNPRVSINRSRNAQPNCAGSACRYLDMDYQDLPAGDYTVTYYDNGVQIDAYYNRRTYRLSGNGTLCSDGGSCTSGIYFGYHGHTVTVVADGPVRLEADLTWPSS